MLIVDRRGRILASNPAAEAALDLGDSGNVGGIAWLDRRLSLDGTSIQSLLEEREAVLGHRLCDAHGNETDVIVDILDLSSKKPAAGPKLIHIRDYSPYTNYERWKDELLSMAAHEIKNPMAAMKSAMNVLLSNGTDTMNEAQRNLLAVSLRSINRLTRLLDNVLDVSRIRSGAYAPECRAIGAREFTAEVVDAFKTLFNIGRRRLTFNVSAELDHIYIDAPKLEQILINLLGNALKFTQEEGEIAVEVAPAGLETLTDDLRILPWGDVAGLKFVRFAVKDNGIGMTGDILAHLFTRHHRNEGGGKPGGAHLGLSISRALVEAQSGAVHCESELGVGTTVTVSLPADETTFTLLRRVKSIECVLARLSGLAGGVTCRVFRKHDASLEWGEGIASTGMKAAVNPTEIEEKSGNSFVWTLTERLAVAVAAGEAEGDGRDEAPSAGRRAPAEGLAVASRVFPARDARTVRLLAFAFRPVESQTGIETNVPDGRGSLVSPPSRP